MLPGRLRRRPARAWRSSTSTTPAASSAGQVAHLGILGFVTARENVILLGPPGTGKTHHVIGLGTRACQAGHRVAFAPLPSGWPAWPTPTPPAAAVRARQPDRDSNKPFGRWGEVFGDDVVAAMIDRLGHHADIIALKATATCPATAPWAASRGQHRPAMTSSE